MRREDGQMLPGLVILLLAMIGLSLMVFEIGRAAVMRSDAQTAADAAALAAARNMRAQLVTQLATRGYSDFALIDEAMVEAAARDYAERNGGKLDKIEMLGADVKAWARSKKDAGVKGEKRQAGEAKARARLYSEVSLGIATGGGFGGSLPGGGRDTSIKASEWEKFGEKVKSPPQCTNSASTNDIVKLGKFLLDHGIVADENAQLGDNPAPGTHTAGGWHYRCGNSGAIDINADAAAGGEKAALDAIAGPIRALGFYVIWQEEDHYDHMHVQPIGGAPGGGGGFGGYGATGSLEDSQLLIKLVDFDAPVTMGFAANFIGSADGIPFGPPDKDVARVACRVLDRLDASPKARLALWEALIVESGVKNLTYGDATSVGPLQLLAMHGSFEKRRDVPWVIEEFLENGYYGRGGAMSLARRHPEWSAGRVAQETQGSAHGERYDQRRLQAISLNKKFCGGKGL